MSCLDYPFPLPPRIAVFSLVVTQSRQVRVFRAGEWKALERFRPHALAGWHSDMVLIGQLYQSGVLSLPDLNAPLLVFTHPDSGPLTDAQYAHLWSLYGVPFFEQIRDSAGNLLAQECEARDGFHLTDPSRPLPNLRPEPVDCPCGRSDRRYRAHATAPATFAAA